MKIKIAVIFTLLMMSQTAFAEDASTESLARKVIQYSGIEKMIESFPAQIEAQYLQRQPVAKDPEIEKEVSEIMVESFDIVRAKKVLYNSIIQNSNKEQFQKMLLWLEAPLYKKLSEAEIETSTPEGQANLMRYAANLQSDPPSQTRVELIQRFERAAQQTEMFLQFFELITYGILSGFMELAPDKEKPTDEQIRKQVDEMTPMMKQLMWQQMLITSHYAYRDFSNNEIEEYIGFLETETGKKYVRLSFNGITEVFNDFLKIASTRFKEYQK